ncbi:hypothetical protein VOLCADRAFT_91636 [Volvox carteri f. nagariensis]|uniref:Uncharacterized protein n=1 Tax=Volvox carteri f. nagariensis TaxID=3068 RepID=D8TXL3_VOLCA|nr:uncharacterized protein VOLCADRAFT_91636 [Volvox carteri f. nagariensis]EFJ47744.1 hypothetical protein VOLCADRAFT_91636 [Volvox carteri f. nagariensis]|eukprot:XP_002951215.1 hypothetical protein VOLCADRAFT_91636 [Volvox carteri f. nagariensis]
MSRVVLEDSSFLSVGRKVGRSSVGKSYCAPTCKLLKQNLEAAFFRCLKAVNATAQGEMLLAKYLTDSIRSIEHAIRKSAPSGAHLSRALSAPRLDMRPDGRRPATEVLLPRKLPLAQAPAVAAALAATRGDDRGGPHVINRSNGQVAATQARLSQPVQSGYGATPLPPRSQVGGNSLLTKPSNAATAAGSLPPRPSVVRTAHAIAAALQHQQQQHQQQPPYGRTGGGGRSTSAPRLDDAAAAAAQPPTAHHHKHVHHYQHHHHHQQQQQQNHHRNSDSHNYPQGPQSEARIPAMAAAPPLLAHGGGAAAAAADVRSVASVRRSAPSDAGTHTSWWRWRPVTDASYPLTAITDRYAQSMSPSEVIKWNDRVARLEAEINQEKERRKQFEEQLKKLQVATSTTQVPGGGGGGGGGKAGGAPKAVVGQSPGFR